MPSKFHQRNFVEGGFYHIYNRGARRKKIFLDRNDYLNFCNILTYYLKFPSGKPISHITTKRYAKQDALFVSYSLVSYCLMPNHFHLLIKQERNPEDKNNIPNFIKRITLTYSLAFKKKYDHSGSLFESKYKNTTITNESQLIYLTKYIHTNPKKFISKLSDYQFSSYQHYIERNKKDWIDDSDILPAFSKIFPNLSYQSFVEEKEDDFESISSVLID